MTPVRVSQARAWSPERDQGALNQAEDPRSSRNLFKSWRGNMGQRVPFISGSEGPYGGGYRDKDSLMGTSFVPIPTQIKQFPPKSCANRAQRDVYQRSLHVRAVVT
jgi:hypothetical protein